MSHASQRTIRMFTATTYLLWPTWSVLWHCCSAIWKKKTTDDPLSHQVTFTRTKKDTSNRTEKFIQKKYVRYFQHTENTLFPTARYEATTTGTAEDKCYIITPDLFATICLNTHTHFTVTKLWMIQHNMYPLINTVSQRNLSKCKKKSQKWKENLNFFIMELEFHSISDAL